MAGSDAVFSKNMPEFYERHIGPMFLHYAADIARRLGGFSSGALLEVAAGTGIVTQALAGALPDSVAITATDLNRPMLDFAAAKPDLKRVTFLHADAVTLPFQDESFDIVVCQFGIMFFPDRQRAHAEARRVLRPGGRYVFNTWDGLAHNPGVEIVERAVAALHPPGTIGFLGRIPFGNHDPDVIRSDLAAAGFQDCVIEWVPSTCRTTARDVAVGFCQGTPLRAEIETTAANGLAKAVEAASEALVKNFGAGATSLPLQALVVETTK